MSTTLSHGYKMPSVGERSFFDELESNITLSNSHEHSGIDGEKIKAKNLSKGSGAILSASWSAVSGQAGTYRQLVTVPTGYTVDLAQIKISDASGNPLLLSIEKASSTTYYVYINDNSLSLTVVYG